MNTPVNSANETKNKAEQLTKTKNQTTDTNYISAWYVFVHKYF